MRALFKFLRASQKYHCHKSLRHFLPIKSVSSILTKRTPGPQNEALGSSRYCTRSIVDKNFEFHPFHASKSSPAQSICGVLGNNSKFREFEMRMNSEGRRSALAKIYFFKYNNIQIGFGSKSEDDLNDRTV